MHLLNIKKQSASEVQYFVTEFNETFEKLKVNVLKEASCKLRLNQLKREEMESYIAQHRPIPEDIYSTMCFYGYQRQFPETIKLFKFALLILPSTANVERVNNESTNISIRYFIRREKPQSYNVSVFGRARKALRRES